MLLELRHKNCFHIEGYIEWPEFVTQAKSSSQPLVFKIMFFFRNFVSHSFVPIGVAFVGPIPKPSSEPSLADGPPYFMHHTLSKSTNELLYDGRVRVCACVQVRVRVRVRGL